MPELRIADASHFNDTEIVQLPSMAGTDIGVMLRRPDLISLVEQGGADGAPDMLSALIVEQLKAPGVKPDAIDLSESNLPKMFAVINQIVMAAFVQPQVVPDDKANVDQGRLPISRIPFADKLFIFNWVLAGKEYSAARNFRDGRPLPTAEPVPARADLPEQPKHNPRN